MYYAAGQRVAMRVSHGPTASPYPAPGATQDEVYYLLGDHLGSTTVTVNQDGTVKSRVRYDAWGKTRYTSGTTPTDRKYTGQIEEAGIGLYFYNARWYDPLLGRFVSPDSIVPNVGKGNNPNEVGYLTNSDYSALTVAYHENQLLEQLNRENKYLLENKNGRMPSIPSNPLAFDRYAYSLNNPVHYVDPTGHFAILAALALISPAGWVAIGAIAVVAIVYYASGGPEVFAEGYTPVLESVSDNISRGIEQIYSTTNSIGLLLANQRNDEDQEALVDLAQEAKKKGGVSEDEAQTLLEWGNEYNVPSHGPEIHPNRNFNQPHIHVGPIGHIPVIPK